jgi:uncharacterized protein YggU (UPF0235/DUF167 family)
MTGAARQSAPVFDVAAVQRVGSGYVEEVRSVKEFVELLAVSALIRKIYVPAGASPEKLLRLYEDAEAFAGTVDEPPEPVRTHAAVRALADALGVSHSLVRIVTGQRSRTKVVEVESANPDVVTALLNEPWS